MKFVKLASLLLAGTAGLAACSDQAPSPTEARTGIE